MALAYRAGSFTSAGNGSGGDLTLTKPVGAVDGDRILILCYFEPDTTTISINTAGWEVKEIANTGAFKIKSFTKIASSEPASYVLSNSDAGDQWGIACGVAYSGGTGSGTVLDTSSSSAQADGVAETAQTAPTITPATSGVMVTFTYGNFSGNNISAMTGFCTNLRGSLGGLAIADAYQTTSAATGTSRSTGGGVGTEDYAVMHQAIIADLAGAATLSLPPLKAKLKTWNRRR